MKNKNLFNSRFVFIFGRFSKKNKTEKTSSSQSVDFDEKSPKELRAEERAKKKEAKRLEEKRREWKAREAKRAKLEEEFDIPEKPEVTRGLVKLAIIKNISSKLNLKFKNNALVKMLRTKLSNDDFSAYISKAKGKNKEEKKQLAYEKLTQYKHQELREKNPKINYKGKEVGYKYLNKKPGVKNAPLSKTQKEECFFHVHHEMMEMATKLKSEALNRYTNSLNFDDLLKYEKKLKSNSESGNIEDGTLTIEDIGDAFVKITPEDSFDQLV